MIGVGIILLAAVFVLFSAGCEKPVSRKQFEERRAAGDDPETSTRSGPGSVGSDNFEDLRIRDGEEGPAPSTSIYPELGSVDRQQVLSTRSKAIGRSFVTLQIGGHYLNDVRIRKIDDSGVQILLKNGLATFAWSDVPKGYLAEWGYDPASEIKMVSDSKGNDARLSKGSDTRPSKSSEMKEQERREALETQIAIIDTRIAHSERIRKEAKGYFAALEAAFEGVQPIEAKGHAEAIYTQIRASRNCSSCAPPTASSGNSPAPATVRDQVMQSLGRLIAQHENEITIDRNRRDQLMAALGR